MDNNDISKRQIEKYVEKYNDHPLSDNVFFIITKRTERIVTAIYMVSGLFPESDPLQQNVRRQAVALLEDVFGCLEAPMRHKSATLSRSIIGVEHLLSLFDMAHTMGLVSDMNLTILRKELLLLQSSLYREMEGEDAGLGHYKEPHTALNYHGQLKKFFDEGYEEVKALEQTLTDIKDTKKSFNKDVVYKQDSVANASKERGKNDINKTTSRSTASEKEARRDKIRSLVKEKGRISMKDIATRITNCTEKTLQRDLAFLIKEGTIEKQGEKRWSSYVYVGKK